MRKQVMKVPNALLGGAAFILAGRGRYSDVRSRRIDLSRLVGRRGAAFEEVRMADCQNLHGIHEIWARCMTLFREVGHHTSKFIKVPQPSAPAGPALRGHTEYPQCATGFY